MEGYYTGHGTSEYLVLKRVVLELIGVMANSLTVYRSRIRTEMPHVEHKGADLAKVRAPLLWKVKSAMSLCT